MDTEWTVDKLANLQIKQSRQGFRFGLDAVLLATDLPTLPKHPHIAEIGSGQGTVALAIAHQLPDAQIWCFERQDGLFALLQDNIERNGLSDRVWAEMRDIRERAALPRQTMDLVVSNPPFFRVGEGFSSPNAERASAHMELHGDLGDFVEAARLMLKQRGRFKVVLPPRRLPDLCNAVSATDFGMESMRWIHPRSGEAAYLFEAVLRRNSKDTLEVGPPLVIHVGDEFSAEVQRRLELR
ncbi:MAG: methyltransferase [bacterium]